MPWGSCVCVSSHAEPVIVDDVFWLWTWHGLFCCIGLFGLPIGESLYSVPLHLPRVVGMEIVAFVVGCWVGVMASVLAWLLLLRSRCVIVIVVGDCM